MTPRRWYAIATLIMLIAVPALSSAATGSNRLANPGCETAGADPFDIPDWTNFRGSPAPRTTARVDAIGNQGAACVVVGPGVLVSTAFPVTGGEEIATFTAFVWEIRDDCGDGTVHFIVCSEPNSAGVVRGDSVVALDFSTGGVDTDGDGIADSVQIVNSFEIHCDDLEDARDNGAFDASEGCTVLDQYVFVEAKNATTDFECDSADLDVIDAAGVIVNHRCAKYDYTICNHTDGLRNDEDCSTTLKAGGCACIAPFNNPLLAGAAATTATVSLGGSLALDADGLLFGLGLESPTSITAFDDVFVD